MGDESRYIPGSVFHEALEEFLPSQPQILVYRLFDGLGSCSFAPKGTLY